MMAMQAQQRARAPIPRARVGPDPNVPSQAPAAAPTPSSQVEQLAAAVAEWDKAWGDINDSNFKYIGTTEIKVPYYAVIPTTVEALANPDGETEVNERVHLSYPHEEKHGLVFSRLQTIDPVTGSIDMWWIPTYCKDPVAGVPDAFARAKESLFQPNYALPGID